MIDISDGLAGDAAHLASASGVGLEIEAARLPVADGVEAVAAAAGADPLDLAVGGGEDYELLVGGARRPGRGRCRAAATGSGSALTEIGVVARRSGRTDQAAGRLADTAPGGFDQLGCSPSAERPRLISSSFLRISSATAPASTS